MEKSLYFLLIVLLHMSTSLPLKRAKPLASNRFHKALDISSITEPVDIHFESQINRNPSEYWSQLKAASKARPQSQQSGEGVITPNLLDQKAIVYWETTPTTYDKAAGTYAEGQAIEIEDSFKTLSYLKEHLNVSFGRAADCGAGVGRVSTNLLTKKFKTVDLFERSHQNLAFAKKSLAGNPHVGEFVLGDLKQVEFDHKYDVIWVQLVSGFFDDDQFVAFYKKCARSLTPNGVVVFKDYTVLGHQGMLISLHQTAVVRSEKYHRLLFEYADLDILYRSNTLEEPENTQSIMTFVLRPRHRLNL